MSTDSELLRRYVNEKAEEAFTEFVRQHAGLVYSSALRRTNGQQHLAEEVTQTVFSDLSRKAPALIGHPCLSAWLYRSTRYAAIDAQRAEQRRRALAHSFSNMHNDPSERNSNADWEKLRPMLDAAMDELKDRDRELILLRFFKGLSFAKVGEKLGLSENAARKRTERSIEKLRSRLGKRGITSTGTALSLILTGQMLAVAPSSVVARVTTLALATPPATGLVGFLTVVLMNKCAAPVLSAVLAAGATSLAWSALPQDLRPEITALQQEAVRLKADSANDAKLADEYSRNANAISQTFGKSQTASGTARHDTVLSPHGYINRGQTTALDAAYTFAWACDVADPQTLAKLIYMDNKTREHARRILLTMPEGVRTQFPTPEDFYGLLLAASCLEAPPPDAAIVRHLMTLVETGQDRVATRMVGSSRNFHEFQQTAEGWKYVLPDEAIDPLPQILNSRTLANLSRHP